MRLSAFANSELCSAGTALLGTDMSCLQVPIRGGCLKISRNFDPSIVLLTLRAALRRKSCFRSNRISRFVPFTVTDAPTSAAAGPFFSVALSRKSPKLKIFFLMTVRCENFSLFSYCSQFSLFQEEVGVEYA